MAITKLISKIKQASLLQNARRVASLHGKGLLRQAMEIWQVRKSNPSLGATDYYTYRIYDERFTLPSSVPTFLGWRGQNDLALSLNHRSTVMPAWDKFTFALIARAFDLPVARLIALYRRGSPPIPGVADVVLDAPARLAEWLRTQTSWPIFAKPSYCQQGFGCHSLCAYDAAGDSLVTKGARRIPVDEFVSDITTKTDGRYYLPEMGYLFQEVMRPHRDIAAVQGNDTISGVRVILIQDAHGIEFVTAAFKVATGNNELDNFRSGKTGNLIADVDLKTGRVTTAVNGIWPNAEVVTRIPGTGQMIEDFILPDWPEVLAMCTWAAAIFPLMRIQHWDVAITDKGPRFLELNDIGSIEGMQLWGKGIVTPRLRDLLRQHGRGRFPWIEKVGA